MLASEVVERLQSLINEHGDKEVGIDNGMFLQEIDDIDLGSEEDNAIVIWPAKVPF